MRRVSGVSFFAVIVTVVILAVAAALIVPRIISNSNQQLTVKAQQELSVIQNALESYKLDNGDYPTTEQGLQALVTQPTISPVPAYWNKDGYLKNLPLDPWGQPYQYQYDQGVVHLYSYGPGGKDGDTEINAGSSDTGSQN
jgi:general secretion pathway protein G